MTIASKVVVAVTTLGTLGGGGGLLTNHLLKKPTVNDKLISEGFKLAEEGDWNNLLTKHNEAKAPNIFEDDGKSKDIAWLKEKCEKALKNSNDNKNYKLARQWCVKEKAIKDIFGNIGLIGLDATGSGNDEGGWKAKETELKRKSNIATKLNTQMNGAENINVTNIKKGCKDIIELKTSNKDFNEKFDLAKEWCAITKKS